MNFSIHLPDKTEKELSLLAKKKGKTRNAMITEVIQEFIKHQKKGAWPKEVYELAGLNPDLVPFESTRHELKKPVDDPLA